MVGETWTERPPGPSKTTIMQTLYSICRDVLRRGTKTDTDALSSHSPRNICRHWRTIAHTAARIFNVPTLRAFPQTPTLLRPANSIFPSGSTPRSHPPLALGLRWSLVSRGKEKERPRAKRKARVCGAISRERMSLYMSYKSAPHETSRVLHVFSCDTVVSCHFFCNLFPETCL